MRLPAYLSFKKNKSNEVGKAEGNVEENIKHDTEHHFNQSHSVDQADGMQNPFAHESVVEQSSLSDFKHENNSLDGGTTASFLSSSSSFSSLKTKALLNAEKYRKKLSDENYQDKIQHNIKKSFNQMGGLLKEPFSLIVFQAGSFGLHGALINNGRDEISMGGFATSSSVDFTRAISEVLGQLKAQHKRLPKKAILLSPSVVSNLVLLPVSPLRPRSNEQMQELIRWELEGAMTQQSIQWKIGSMLVERGRMTAEQRNHVLEELEITQAQSTSKAMSRFGDLAIQLAYIRRDDLEECFALQGKLVALDDELEYGWQASETSKKAPSDEILLSQEDDNDSSHPWLVSGMSKTVRRRWLGAFNLNGLSLEAFYPTVSSPFASLAIGAGQSIKGAPQKLLLLEVYQEQLALISGKQGVVTGTHTGVRQPGQLTAAECLELLRDNTSDVKCLYIAANGIENIQQVMLAITEQLNIEVQLISRPFINFNWPDDINADALLGIHGASNHFYEHIDRKCLSQINTTEKKEQAWKSWLNTKNYTIAAGVLLVCAMTGFLGWMKWSTVVHTTRLAELSAKYDKEIALQQKLKATYSDSLKVENEIKRGNKRLIRLNELLATQGANAGYRQQSVHSLLKVFVLSLSPSASVSSISKNEQDQFFLEVIIPSNLEGQELVSRLDRLAKPLRYQVAESSVNAQAGGRAYHVKITLDYNAGLSQYFERLAGRPSSR